MLGLLLGLAGLLQLYCCLNELSCKLNGPSPGLGIANKQAWWIGCAVTFIQQSMKPLHNTKTAQILNESVCGLLLEGAWLLLS